MLGNGLGRSVEQQLVPIALMLFTGQRDGATGRMGKEIAVDVKRQARCLLSRKIGVKQAVALARMEGDGDGNLRSEEHTSELQSLMRISYAVFCSKKNKT